MRAKSWSKNEVFLRPRPSAHYCSRFLYYDIWKPSAHVEVGASVGTGERNFCYRAAKGHEHTDSRPQTTELLGSA